MVLRMADAGGVGRAQLVPSRHFRVEGLVDGATDGHADGDRRQQVTLVDADQEVDCVVDLVNDGGLQLGGEVTPPIKKSIVWLTSSMMEDFNSAVK